MKIEKDVTHAPYRQKKAFSDTNIWKKSQTFYNLYLPVITTLRKDIRETIGYDIINNMQEVIKNMAVSYDSKKIQTKYKYALKSKGSLKNVSLGIKTLYEQHILDLHKTDMIISNLSSLGIDLNRWINTLQKDIQQKNNNIQNMVKTNTDNNESE